MTDQIGVMYHEANGLGQVHRLFLEMLPTMTRVELTQLIAKRPTLWSRFSGYLTSGHRFVGDTV